jgi:hypothetical protein
MARRGNDDALKALGGVALLVLLIYLRTGRGRNNSRLIPDALEDRIDRLIEVLNREVGPRWVDLGLDALQIHIERTMPQLAGLVRLVHWAEQRYRFSPNAGLAKKTAVLRSAA